MTAITTLLNKTIEEVIFQATCEASNEGIDMTQESVQWEIESALMFINFENESAKSTFQAFLSSGVKKALPVLFPPPAPVGMDQRGNWTTDASKWV